MSSAAPRTKISHFGEKVSFQQNGCNVLLLLKVADMRANILSHVLTHELSLNNAIESSIFKTHQAIRNHFVLVKLEIRQIRWDFFWHKFVFVSFRFLEAC